VAKTFDTIRKGKNPKVLQRVKDLMARDLIEKCLEPSNKRLFASMLLNHPFFQKPKCSEMLTDQYALNNPIEGISYMG